MRLVRWAWAGRDADLGDLRGVNLRPISELERATMWAGADLGSRPFTPVPGWPTHSFSSTYTGARSPLDEQGARDLGVGHSPSDRSERFALLALGFASLVGSRAVTNGVLIGWQFIASPLLEHVSLLGGARQALYTGALDRLNPAPVLDQGPPTVVRSVVVAFVVLAAWIAASLAAGGWRTATRDA